MQFDFAIRLYEYWHEQVKIRKKRWNNKEIKKFYWKLICKQKVRKRGVVRATSACANMEVIKHIITSRGVTIHFFHKRYVSRYLICITIRFVGNCNYSLKSMLVDMSHGRCHVFFIWGRLRTSEIYKYLIFD
jgi:hypothetical protein